jgi:hypothetical protein
VVTQAGAVGWRDQSGSPDDQRVFDYPSQRSGLQSPAEPMLLDTCVIQNLMAIGDVGEDGHLTDEGERLLLSRFGPTLTEELVVLDAMLEVFARNGMKSGSDRPLGDAVPTTDGRGRPLTFGAQFPLEA